VEEFRICLPDGSERWISSNGRWINDGTRDARMTGASTDITARMISEHELSEQRSRLAQLSRVGMLGELSGSFAHELNQPLTAILSNAQAAQRFLTHPDPDLLEIGAILDDIVAEDRRAGEVIRRLRLMFSKGEVERQPVVIRDLVSGVMHLLRNDLINRGVIAKIELEADLPVVEGDLVGLQQVLINLVMNACDAMVKTPRSDRQVTLAAITSPHGVELSVSDNGTGIAPEKVERIFDSFYTEKANGMGLGLSVCRTIIRAHGGRLWAANHSPRGAVFRFELPVPSRQGHLPSEARS
jgi:C4-dicarboxylate-specific signal transduction histidine kinase